MNIRGFAAYTDFVESKNSKNCTSTSSTDKSNDEDNSNYYSTNSSEEENPSSNGYEILEKLNQQIRYNFNLIEFDQEKLTVEYYLLDLYDMLKPGLSTPPPEFV